MGKSKGSLPPGFRFHPTDLELIRFYLRRKLMGKPLLFEAIAVVDLYKFSPWDLPDKSCLRSKDLEWYFFCPRDRKYANGQRTNRATEKGYWKTTGKDRTIVYKDMTVGMKKTLVFYLGRAPNGSRTDWVMHEYRLEDKELIETDFSQDTFVLCRIFQKSGPGPKNGEQYGAPFSEEEWDYDEEDDVASHSHLSLAPDSESPSLGLAHDNSPLSLIVHENDTPDTVAAPFFIELNSSDCDLENMLLNFVDNEDFELLPGVDQMANSGKEASARDDTSAIFDGLGDITTKEELQAIDKLNLEDDNFVEIDDLSVVDAVEADSFGHGTFAASDILGDPSSWEMEMAQFLRDPSSASWEMETLN